MRRRRVAAVLSAGLVLGGGTAVAVGLGTQEPAPVTVPDRSGADVGAVPGPAVDPSTSSQPSSQPSAQPSGPQDGTPPADPATRVAQPGRVRIPAIGVDSGLLHLGLNDDGTIEVPAGEDIDSAAWFDGSPRPGADGPAVIEGHVDSPNGPSVFYRLSELEAGQRVHVDREDGSTATFVVERVEQYSKKEFPTREVYANTDGPELRLITCGGEWDPEWGHYVDNTVVFARLA
ncbi:class F sortase [Isoptericola sp. BMS4]|uniref:class F sortase n=1 Tax=Isoptericola sp. BMS4 TaxID=2527875 RepID=UPI00141F9722|nr:class F sortase [Isoptericola sp. BMS4]